MKTKKDINQFEPERFWKARRRNFEETEDYVVSRETMKALPSVYNTDDIIQRNVFTECELMKKNLHELEQKHATTLENAKTKRLDLNQQWVELEKTELEFRNNFKYFDQFVRENEMKRLRASVKMVEMQHLVEKRSEDNDITKKHIVELRESKLQMDNAIKKLRIFEVIE